MTGAAWLTAVRIARDTGGVEALLPEGCTLLDAPYPLFQAINLALTFLEWEELPDDERPSREIWLDNEKLTEHWKMVRRLRKQKMRGTSTPAPDDDDGEPQHNGFANQMLVN